MKQTWIARLSALALALVLLAGLCPAAFADGGDAAPRYKEDTALEKVYAVRVGGGTEEDCAALFEAMQTAGFDAYLYESGGRLNVLCGKFRDHNEAGPYRGQIKAAVKGTKAQLCRAWLPAEAVDAFEQAQKPEEQKAAQPAARRTSSWEQTEGTLVYSVSLSMSQKRDYAEGIVAYMQEKGFDAYIIESANGFQVLSGKFHDICNALKYRDCIWSNTDRTDTYITQVTLSGSEIDAFTERYEREGLPGRIKSDLEQPTGPFYREANGNTLAYTVQFSAGTSFSGAERNRDAMTAAGYPSFVYECSRIYECMSGAFYSREDADAYCQQLKDDTGRSSAYVTSAWLPAGIVK